MCSQHHSDEQCEGCAPAECFGPGDCQERITELRREKAALRAELAEERQRGIDEHADCRAATQAVVDENNALRAEREARGCVECPDQYNNDNAQGYCPKHGAEMRDRLDEAQGEALQFVATRAEAATLRAKLEAATGALDSICNAFGEGWGCVRNDKCACSCCDEVADDWKDIQHGEDCPVRIAIAASAGEGRGETASPVNVDCIGCGTAYALDPGGNGCLKCGGLSWKNPRRAAPAPASPSPLADDTALAVPRGHCNRCDRCGWPLGTESGQCRIGDCSFRPMPAERDTCAGCGALFIPRGAPASPPVTDVCKPWCGSIRPDAQPVLEPSDYLLCSNVCQLARHPLNPPPPSNAAPTDEGWIDEEGGGHGYSRHDTSDCSYGCGCWADGRTSSGPHGIDPLGRCPRNPRNAAPTPGSVWTSLPDSSLPVAAVDPSVTAEDVMSKLCDAVMAKGRCERPAGHGGGHTTRNGSYAWTANAAPKEPTKP